MVNTSLRCIKPESDQLRTKARPLLYYHGPVVQQDRTPVCGTGGQEFESLRVRQNRLTNI